MLNNQAPLRPIHEIETEWLAKFDEVRAIAGDDVAAPFLSIPPLNYDGRVPLVMYVGQATYGSWYLDEFLAARTVGERHARTKQWLENVEPTESAFWRFGFDLSRRIGELSTPKIQPLRNLVWTNVSKIGRRPTGNPRPKLRTAQRALAVETLSCEIQHYRPRLIVFATADYESDVIGAVIGDPEARLWHKERASDWIWWRESRDSISAILWVGHPRQKSREVIQLWLQQASALWGDMTSPSTSRQHWHNSDKRL